MKKILIAVVATGVFGLLPLHASAEDATKLDRVGEGVVDTVTSPGKIVEGISEDTQAHGTVVGSAFLRFSACEISPSRFRPPLRSDAGA